MNSSIIFNVVEEITRPFLKCAVLILILLLSQCSGSQDGTVGLAISLRELASDLDSPLAYSLYNTTRIEGMLFTTDARGMDCILVARKEPGRPVLRLDDFAVAYSNIMKGTQRPGCSIDPRKECLRQLDKLSNEMSASPNIEEMDQFLNEWERLSSLPQDVRIFGVEPDTLFAKVMVDADYFLKSICNGSEELEGIRSHSDLLLEEAKANLAKNDKLTIPLDSYNRFWFNPGEILFAKNRGLLLLTRCEVTLKTEEEAVSLEGDLEGLGKPNPYARRFTARFTERYDEIAVQKPIYRKLENLYRFVALADLLRRERSDAKDVVDRLFERVKIQRFEYPLTLPGKYGLKKIERYGEEDDVSPFYRLFLPSCGGVCMTVVLTQKNIKSDSSWDSTELKNRMLRERPSVEAVCWPFEMSPPMLAKIVHISFNVYSFGLIAYIICCYVKHPKIAVAAACIKQCYSPFLERLEGLVKPVRLGQILVDLTPLLLLLAILLVQKIVVWFLA